MAIIETLKQGNNEYNFNKKFLNIDSSGYFFENVPKVFRRWFRSPLYFSSSKTNLSKSTYDFKKPYNTIYTITDSDFELHHTRSYVYNLINDEEDAGYLFFVFPTDFKIKSGGTNYTASYIFTYDNFYSNQMITDIDFSNNDDIIVSSNRILTTKREITVIENSKTINRSSSYKYCNSPMIIDQITHEVTTTEGTTTVLDGYRYRFKTYEDTSLKISDINFSYTNKKIISTNYDGRFGGEIQTPAYNYLDFDLDEAPTSVRGTIDFFYLDFIVGIKVLNWSSKSNEYDTVHEYLKNEIINNGQEGKITVVNSNKLYTEEEFQNNSNVITTEIGKYYQIWPSVYTSNYNIYYRDDNDLNLIPVNDLNNYIFFTQDEIDSIFNPS